MGLFLYFLTEKLTPREKQAFIKSSGIDRESVVLYGVDQVLCVPSDDPRQEHLRDIHHLAEFDRAEIQHFFEIYKTLEPGKSVEGATWVGRADAEREIKASRLRAKNAGH